MPPKKRMKPKPRDNGRRMKKKVSVLNTEKIGYIDYKDVNLLRRFMSDRAKIRNRRVTGNNSQQQREVARAIKNAREMALVPYANRVTTQRGGKNRDDRGPRSEGAAPKPSVPPPPPGGVGSSAPGAGSEDADATTSDVPAEVAVDGETFEYPTELENTPADGAGEA